MAHWWKTRNQFEFLKLFLFLIFLATTFALPTCKCDGEAIFTLTSGFSETTIQGNGSEEQWIG